MSVCVVELFQYDCIQVCVCACVSEYIKCLLTISDERIKESANHTHGFYGHAPSTEANNGP